MTDQTNDSHTSRARVLDKGSSFALSRTTVWLVTAIVAVGLAVDSYVHWHLAPSLDSLKGTASPHISQGQLFRLEAVLALVALVLVLATRRRFASGLAFLIAAGGLAALLLYGFVDVGGLGPIPDMYDPTWYAEKTSCAIAEAVAAVGALWLLLSYRPDR